MTHHVNAPSKAPVTKREPALSIGSISALVSAVLALIVVLGVSLPEGFEAAILGVIAAAGPIVAGLITRGKVWSQPSHEADRWDSVLKERAAAENVQTPQGRPLTRDEVSAKLTDSLAAAGRAEDLYAADHPGEDLWDQDDETIDRYQSRAGDA